MTTTNINASSPSGNGRRIPLLSTDLIFGSIDNVFVYPNLDVNRLQDALRSILSFWPILTGRIIVENDDEYLIECSDNSIPFTSTENTQLQCWPDLPVVVDDITILQPFIDFVQYKPEVEVLLRFKMTHLVHSDEYVFGTSFSHLVGDAHANIRFLNDLSRIYQNLQPLLPRPIFDRQLIDKEKADFSLPLIKNLSEAAEKRTILHEQITKEQSETEPINISFSSKELIQLHSLIENNDQVTIHDALCAYVILTLNKELFSSTDEYIRHIHMVVNYRGISTPIDYAGNSLLTTLSSDFVNPLSLSNIAKTIRQSIKTIRNEDVIEKYIITADILSRQLLKDDRLNFIFGSDKFVFNSNLKYNWTNEVDFGMINQCRFHTMGIYKFYFRIFRLNPVKNEDGIWICDNNGAEISFRIPKGEEKDKFFKAYKKDIEENFVNVC